MARIALFDACVLYPAPLRDLLMWLALTDLFQARWTAEIHDEWMRNVLADRPDISPASLKRCRELMDKHVPDCLVSGYEPLIPTVSLPDPDDRHVLAAAVHGGAGVIVTFNLGDFPAAALGPYGIEAVHPDDFVVRLWAESAAAVLGAVRLHRASLKRPPKTAAEYLATLEQCRLAETTTRLRPHAEEDYADKWSRDPRLEKSFYEWHAAVRADIAILPASIEDGSLKSRARSIFRIELTERELRQFTASNSDSVSVVVRTAPALHIPSAPRPWGQ